MLRPCAWTLQSQNDKKDLWKQFKKDQGKSYKDGSSEVGSSWAGGAFNLPR